jgi:imidazolonepropionase-like amidohydrolase
MIAWWLGVALAQTPVSLTVTVPPSLDGQPPCEGIVDATVYTPDGPKVGWDVLWTRGKITAVGESVPMPKMCRVRVAEGWHVTAGLIAMGTGVGVVEVDLESVTRDDSAGVPEAPAFRVVDAFNPRSAVVPMTRMGGITTAMVVPSGGWASGQAAAVSLDGGAWADSVVSPHVGVVVDLHATGSSARTWQLLHQRLEEARWFNGQADAYVAAERVGVGRTDLKAWSEVALGKVPLWIHADRASDLEVLAKFAIDEKVRVHVLGGAEAWLVAGALAQAKVGVVLDPFVYGAGSFDQIHGAADNAAKLHAAGVTIGLYGAELHTTRTLRQLAGNAVRGGLSHAAALAAVTSGPATLLGLTDRGRIAEGAVADLAVWSSDPLDTPARLLDLRIAGAVVPLASRQTALTDAWRVLPSGD